MRDFSPADLAPHRERWGIADTVLIQSAPTEAETQFLLDIAAREPSVLCVACDLCFDALIQPRPLPTMVEFSRRYPELRIVVDHGAKPDIAGRRIAGVVAGHVARRA